MRFKGIILAVISAIILSVIFQSCEKKSFNELEVTHFDLGGVHNKLTSCSDNDLDSIQIVDGMLKFNSVDHFRRVLECLEYEVEAHNDSFETAYSSYTDEQMDSIADLIGFNEWQPLVDFDTRLGFYSRRKYIEDKIVQWLDTSSINIPLQNNPDNLDGVSEELRTLLNVDGNVMIDNSTYNFIVSMFNPQCRRIHHNYATYVYDNGNKYYEIKVAVNSLPIVKTMTGKVTNFAIKKGKWKRSRARLFVQVSGYDRDADCNFPLPDGAFKGPKRRKSLTAKSRYWQPPTWIKFKKKEVQTLATINSTISGTVLLNW